MHKRCDARRSLSLRELPSAQQVSDKCSRYAGLAGLECVPNAAISLLHGHTSVPAPKTLTAFKSSALNMQAGDSFRVAPTASTYSVSLEQRHSHKHQRSHCVVPRCWCARSTRVTRRGHHLVTNVRCSAGRVDLSTQTVERPLSLSQNSLGAMASSYPILDNKQLLTCLNEMDVKLTAEQLIKPTPDVVRNAYEHLVIMLLGVEK